MYRFGAMLLAVSLLFGCSAGEEATDLAENAGKAAERLADAKKDASKVATETNSDTPSNSADPTVSPAESAFASLMAESEKAEGEFMQKVRSAPPEEQMALYMSGGEKKKFAAKFLEFANANLESDPAFEAAMAAARNGDDATSTKALTLVVDNFSDDNRLIDLLPQFDHGGMGMPAQRHEDFLKNLAKKSSNKAIKGGSSFVLYKVLSSLGELQGMVKEEPDMAKSLPQETIAYLSKDRGDDLDKTLIAILDDVSKNYSNARFQRSTLGKLVGEEKFVLENLSIGKVAPDIEGIDLDDKPFKLSDYRGKVVMLDFWGDW